MNKEIYKDELGLYLVEYNAKGEPKKVYCNENGEKELFQDANGLYYVEYDEQGLPAKAYCDENGNRLDLIAAEDVPATTEVSVASENTEVEAQNLANETIQTAQQENTTHINQEKLKEGVFASVAAANMTPPPNNVFFEEKEKKSKGVVAWLGIALVALGLTFGGYFAYANFLAKPSVNLENYQVSFVAKGTSGQGLADVKVDGIPIAENTGSKSQEEIEAIDRLLVEPTISYSKDKGLSNGDQVEVTLNIDPVKAEKYNLSVKGEFKQNFMVSGLSEASASSSSSNSDKKEESAKSNESEKKSSSNEPNKNWFVVNGQHRADDGNHPDTQLRNGFNSWAAGQGLSLERMKGGSEFGGTILGNKIGYNGKQIDLRFIRYYGENQDTIKAGEILKDTYNVVGVFSDKSSVIYITAIYNGKAHVFKAELDGGKPETKDGLIVFEDTDNSEVKNMLQGVIDRMK